jgi:hypothetical protein
MKINQLKNFVSLGAAMLALGSGVSTMAQTYLTDSYTNGFDLGANTASFSGSGSVASWIYWYNTPGGNSPMTCVYGLDANNNTTTSGCLEMDSPFLGVNGTQNVIFGTFGNQYGYDFSKRANLLLYTNITFDLRVPQGMPVNGSGNFGSIGVGIINSGYGYQQFGSVTIPASASNGWVHFSVPIDKTQNNLTTVPGLAFDINNYGGYPQFNFTNYIDNVQLHLSPVKTPPPTLAGSLPKPTPGLNEIATQVGGQYNRYQVKTVASSGLGFADQPSVTYSWNIQAFPQNTGGNFQQHMFLVGGVPGPYDQAADYNFANVVFITVQQADNNGLATLNFRYKTNEPAGNGMLFNGTSPTNTVSNPNAWPVQPVCSLQAASAVGNWSVQFVNQTNVTITGPGGVTTNFVFDPASAALFADPLTICLGGQPNNANGYGKGVVYGSFAVTGNDVPFSDNFLTDSALNTGVWADLSNDPNGDIFVPQGSAYWVNWTLPDAGFTLQTAAAVNGGPFAWTDLSPTNILDNGARQALVPASALVGTNTGYFRLISRTFTQLQVLLPGETNAPNTVLGKSGTPTVESVGGIFNVTVNACDNTWHIVSSADTVVLNSATDTSVGNTAPGNALVNGTVQVPFYFDTAGSQTVTATDTTSTNISASTSSTVTAQ